MDSLDELINYTLVIKSDPELKDAFVKILSMGSYTQQIRVAKVSEILNNHYPPEDLKKFLALLSDDKIANLVHQELLK